MDVRDKMNLDESLSEIIYDFDSSDPEIATATAKIKSLIVDLLPEQRKMIEVENMFEKIETVGYNQCLKEIRSIFK